MIKKIRHKGLRALFETGNTAGVRPDQVKRLRRILAILDSAGTPTDLQGFPGLRPHRLKGEYAGYWSVTVSGNWRLVFRFEGEDVTDVNLIDYH